MAAGESERTVGCMTVNPTAAPEILVVGGGIAALEFVLALRDLAGDRVHVTIVAPEPDFVLRPMLVAEPLGRGAANRRPLSRIASDLGCRLVPAAVASVDPARRRVVLFSGDTLPYDIAGPRSRRADDPRLRRRDRARRRGGRRGARGDARRDAARGRAQRRLRRTHADRLAAAALRGRAAHGERAIRFASRW